MLLKNTFSSVFSKISENTCNIFIFTQILWDHFHTLFLHVKICVSTSFSVFNRTPIFKCVIERRGHFLRLHSMFRDAMAELQERWNSQDNKHSYK